MRRNLAAAVAIALVASAPTFADIVDIGRFVNTGWGTIDYQGDFADFITAEQRGDRIHYTVIMIDLEGLLRSIGVRTLFSVSTIDTGENIYTGAPGADIDLFRFSNVNETDLTFLYDGPTSEHQNETSDQLLARVRALDWGTGNGGPSGGKFVSLGRDGILTSVFNDPYVVLPGNGGGGSGGLTLELSEAGNLESFFIMAETASVPAPGALALLGVAAVAARRSRRRC